MGLIPFLLALPSLCPNSAREDSILIKVLLKLVGGGITSLRLAVTPSTVDACFSIPDAEVNEKVFGKKSVE
jgi:hypothetical protein